jgi:hypothetical protein
LEQETLMATNEWDESNRPPLPQPTFGKIAEALAKAQADMSNPGFDAQNPHFRNRYASLAAVRNAIVPKLAKHGICITQDLSTSDRGLACTTILTHLSGERMVFGPLVLPATKQDAQGYGSCATYARRYALMAVAGVVGDDDDDAEAAVGRPAEDKGRIDPRGEGWKKQDTTKVKALAERFRKALKDESDPGIHKVHLEIVADHDLYIAVGEELEAGQRRLIKEAVARIKEGGAPVQNGRGAHDIG